MNFLNQPWPWYVAGPIIGLTVPILLILGNKSLGISSTLRQICAACVPAKITLFNYDWRQDNWNLFFVIGILIGGFLGGYVFRSSEAPEISSSTITYLKHFHLGDPKGLLPGEIFSFQSLLTLRGFLMIVIGGFLVGFGTRYARGCTSGHGIFGLSALQWPSFLATASFFIGGILFSYFLLPYVLML